MSRTKMRPRAVASVLTAGAMVAATMAMATTTAQAAPEHVDNPYAGATQYVNANWSANVNDAAGRAGGTLGAQMRAIADTPTGVWMDRTGAIHGNVDGPGLRWHLDAALEQKVGSTPIVLTLVVYNLPGRDCYALASNGELDATPEGMAHYQNEYIDPIAEMLAEPQYEDIRIAAVIEPDSLPNLITNMSDQKCQESAPYYREGVAYALDAFYPIPNVYTYIDAAHAGWLGWEDNAGPAAELFAEVARSTQGGFATVDGFVTNTANTTPLKEPYLTDPNQQINGMPVRSASFYEWNSDFDEAAWTAQLHRRLVAAGFPARIGMLVDTSRNGWGGADRPTGLSTSTNLDTFVDQSRIDRRTHRGAWCNPAGAGLGERPTVNPSGFPGSNLDALVWVKPPGESDGSSSDIPNDEGKSFDRMCDPTFVAPKLDNTLTGALPNAPVSGKWFEEQFIELVQNAYPPVDPAGGPAPTDPPVEPTDPPVEPTDPPVEPTDPPVEPTDPPVEPTDPPVEPTTPPAGGCTAELSVVGSWGGGYQAEVRVTAGGAAISSWSTSLTLPSGGSVQNLWSGTLSGSGSSVTVANAAWNGSLGSGQTTTYGFIGSGSAPSAGAVTCSAG